MTLHEITKYTNIDEHGNECPVVMNEKTGEARLKKPRFLAFTKSNFPAITKLSRDNPMASSVYLFFIENMDNSNALIASYESMQEHFGKSRKTIYNAIKFLKKNNYLSIIKSGNMNVYCINAQIVWSQSQEKIQYAKFNATVYVSKKEQAKYDLTKKII
jgi:hypothetical protein